MIKREFGSTSHIVPVIGQGTWQFESSKAAVEKAQKALRAGIEKGMSHIDTAELYGKSEIIIAEAIKDMPRSELFIVSKVSPSNASYKGTLAACERSLKRLGTDYLDCYLLHWRGQHPLSETISALEKLVDEGKIRSLGVSNFDLSDLQEAEKLASKHRLACNQVLYNIYERGIERRILPYCREKQIAVVAYTPFGQKKIPSTSSPGGCVLQDIAEKHGGTVRQIMLAFAARLNNLFTIPKASREDHAIENAAAGDLVLDTEDIARIDEVFPAPERAGPLATL